MTRQYLFLVLFFLMNSSSMGQMMIKVLDAQNQLPIHGVSLTHQKLKESFITDSLGIVDLKSGTGNYEVRHIGFKSKVVNINHESGEQNILLEPDFIVLDAVEVRGYENNNSYLSVAGGFSLVSKANIDEFNQESLVRAVNTTPGVRMEERSPSSYRLSIRGSLLRAPFGVRNVKVYWDDIPYTDPTGNSYLYFIDNENVSSIEILKGPSGSNYGAGMGGTMLLKSEQSSESGLHGNVGYTTGSFGFQKVLLGINHSNETSRTTFNFASQKADGYRDHTNSDRKVFQLQNEINYNKGRVFIHLLYSELFYQLPGGLTQEQYDENPKQARNISQSQNAFIDHQNILIGIGNQYMWNEETGNITTLYYNSGIKENPFITNYEIEKLRGIGGRTKFFHNGQILDNTMVLTGGVEFQYGDFNAKNYDNNSGYSGDLRFEDESGIFQGFVFGQAEYSSKSNWIMSISGSLNYLKYNINRLREVATDSSYQIIRTFNPVFSPRLSVVKKLNPELSLHASISQGFSPPTQEEIRTSDGAINEDIEAETGLNYEIGVRGNSRNNRLMYDVTAFYMTQNNTIVSRIEAGGNSTFENSGSTSQGGIESLVAFSIIDQPDKLISFLQVRISYTYHDFIFKEYIKSSGQENVDYAGNELTGTAPNILVTGLQLKSVSGVYLFANYNFTDKIPLDDANSVYADSYQLINLKLGWEKVGKYRIDIFSGIDNVLNEKYSLGNDLNAFGGRYFEPSPERNYYLGLKMAF